MRYITKSILILILTLSLASSYYSGETITINNTIGEDIIWTIVENTSEIIILPEINVNKDNITIYLPSNMPPNDFSIVFLEEETKEVLKEVYISGGGTRTRYVNNYEEVPNYITEYKDKIVEKEIPIEKLIENNETKTPLWAYVVLFLFVVLGISTIFIIKYYSKENIEVKGGNKR